MSQPTELQQLCLSHDICTRHGLKDSADKFLHDANAMLPAIAAQKAAENIPPGRDKVLVGKDV